MTGPDTEHDLYDITGQVTVVTAESPLLAGTALPGFTNGESYYFTDSQIGDISQMLSEGQLRRRAGGGWEEVVPGKGVRYLAERRINGTTYYRLRKHWQFVTTAS